MGTKPIIPTHYTKEDLESCAESLSAEQLLSSFAKYLGCRKTRWEEINRYNSDVLDVLTTELLKRAKKGE